MMHLPIRQMEAREKSEHLLSRGMLYMMCWMKSYIAAKHGVVNRMLKHFLEQSPVSTTHSVILAIKQKDATLAWR